MFFITGYNDKKAYMGIVLDCEQFQLNTCKHIYFEIWELRWKMYRVLVQKLLLVVYYQIKTKVYM